MRITCVTHVLLFNNAHNTHLELAVQPRSQGL